MGRSRFKARNVATIWRKELLDLVRDRRTLMSMIVVPILMVPVLMVGAGAIVASSMQELEDRAYTVGVIGADRAPRMLDSLATVPRTELLELESVDEAKRLVSEGALQGAVVLPDQASLEAGENASVQVILRREKETSTIAMERVEEKLSALQHRITVERLNRLGATESILTPFAIEEVNLTTEDRMLAKQLASFLPYILILMTLTGAMYPAIDLTAGEKERSTLETLLASSAGRLEIVLGKYLTVMTTGIVSAILSLTSMVAMWVYGAAWLSNTFGEPIQAAIEPLHMLYAVLMIVPLAGLFAAVLMIVCIFAKSTREAQSYVSPLMILVILPAMMSMMPGNELSASKAWTPVVNISLVLRDILSGTVDPVILGNALLSNTVYAVIAIALTVRVFQRESVLFRT